jgi:hypothetical protein
MRSPLLILLVGLTFATTTARAQSTSLERNMISAVCSRQATPAAGERVARRLNLTDVQKSALKDMTDAFASADAAAEVAMFRQAGSFYDAGPNGVHRQDVGDQACRPEGNRAEASGVL